MRGMLLMVVFTLATTATVAGQVTDEQSTRTTDEQVIVALSRRFADDAVINDATVVKDISGTNPESVILERDGEANLLGMEQIKVKVDGDKATLTSHLILSGRRSSGDAYKHVHGWRVNLVKQAAGWKVVNARMGNVNN